ncbi:sushi, nidogen and EGF-like domain-containing protein 1 [Megalobrama amblycephala]|uniref:sushi, nidogen and EGF-like domain-containing protein 1 n=1 Tax=Megalobrama amblycephala TaxID=75352 RepID=UPI002013F109|nr:sushi, nidogen and EGF-like domain-containing protein 1 [Megalobrama amblycephala]
MRISLLLVLMSVLSLTRTQTTTEETIQTNTTETTTVIESTPESTTVLESTAETTTTVLETTTLATTSAPAIFYPFGSAAGDTEHYFSSFVGDESFVYVGLSTPYTFFGHTYNQLYVHSNGLLTFNQPQPASGPNHNPTRGAEDFIAPLWSDIDDYYSGMFSYQQYTNESVLTRATEDINQYFPQMNFTASSVFVVTWKYSRLQPNPEILFQVVLISGGGHSFFLMNYGDCAELSEQVEAGYDTINSISHFVIPDSTNGNYQNLKNTSNVNVPGRWAFISTSVSLIGVQMRLTSYSDLRQSGEIEAVLQQIKQELVSRGLPSSIEMKIRNVKKTQP